MEMIGLTDSGQVWRDRAAGDFVAHYRNGGGRTIRLRDTGHLRRVVAEYWRQVRENLLGQIADAARRTAASNFSYSFENRYPFKHIVFDLGDATVGGVARASRRVEGSKITIFGKCDFYFYDRFSDALDVFNILSGLNLDLPGADPYDIKDNWQGLFHGVFDAERDRSVYRYDS